MEGKINRKLLVALVSIVLVCLAAIIFWQFYQRQQVLAQEQQRIEEEQRAAQAAQEEQQRQIEAENARLADIKNKIISGDVADLKVVFLTFDDGPMESSAEVLDTLAANNVKATFFTNGHEGPEAEEIYRRIVNEGHVLGNHTYSHDYDNYNNPEAFYADLQRQEDYIRQVTGTEPVKVFRFPGGSNGAPSELIDGVLARGYSYFDWTASAGDGSDIPLTPEQVLSKQLTEIYANPVSVVLCHAENPAKEQTRAALDQLIKQLQSEGYTFLTLDPAYSIARF